jgi:hypothetical protein
MTNRFFVSSASLMAVSLLASIAPAAALVNYSFSGQPGTQATTPVTSLAPNVTASAISRGSGISATAAGDSMNSNSFNTPTFDATAYYEVSVAPAAGYYLNLDSLRYGNRRSSTGPSTIDIRSSLDSFSSVVATYAAPTSATAQTIPLGTAFDLITSQVTFRIYGYVSTNSAGTFRLENSTVGGFNIDGVAAQLVVPNVNPIVSILTDATVTIDVSGPGLEGFEGLESRTVSASDSDGTVLSLLASGIDPQIADNLSIVGSAAGPLSVSGSGFTYADLGTYSVNFTATDDDGGTGTASLTIQVVPEPTLIASALAIPALRRRRSN